MIKKKFIFISAIISLIVLFLVVRDFRRIKKDIEILDKITFIAGVSSNTGLLPVHEKVAYLSLLKFYDEELDLYLKEASSDDIKWKIYNTKSLIIEQEKRISRLNKFIYEPLEINECIESEENICYQIPPTEDLSTLHFIFKCSEDSSNILAIKADVYVEDSLIYSQLYKNETINSIIVPHFPKESSERIDLGYITKDHKFKYVAYGKT